MLLTNYSPHFSGRTEHESGGNHKHRGAANDLLEAAEAQGNFKAEAKSHQAQE